LPTCQLFIFIGIIMISGCDNDDGNGAA